VFAVLAIAALAVPVRGLRHSDDRLHVQAAT
jgi:hypothetical protein